METTLTPNEPSLSMRPDEGPYAPTPIGSKNTGTEPSKCAQCNRTFKNQWALNVHISRKHSGKNWASIKKGSRMGGRKSKTCPICERLFTTRASMTHHMRNSHKRSVLDFPELVSRQTVSRFRNGKHKPRSVEASVEKPSRAGTETQTQPTDNLAEAARAIVTAARVLQSVSIGMRL